MINVTGIEKKFDEYVSHYDPTNERVKLKIEHIKRVAQNAKMIAQSLNLSEEKVNLAIAIGYFHDIARFEQIRIANTFSDKESHINHGELGAKVLRENDFIRNFIKEPLYDHIIQKAVINHNRPKIEEGLSDEELLFCKIIRDADKLDIFYTISQDRYSMQSIFWYPQFDAEGISNKILEEFKKEITIDYSLIHTNSDVIVIFYAYIYDLYFPITKKILYQKQYLEAFTQRVIKTFSSPKVHKQTKELLEISQKYLSLT